MKKLMIIGGLFISLTTFAAEKKIVTCDLADSFYRKMEVEFRFATPTNAEAFITKIEDMNIKVPAPFTKLKINQEYKIINTLLGVGEFSIVSAELPRAMFNPDETNTIYDVKFETHQSETVIGSCLAE